MMHWGVTSRRFQQHIDGKVSFEARDSEEAAWAAFELLLNYYAIDGESLIDFGECGVLEIPEGDHAALLLARDLIDYALALSPVH